MTHNPFVERLEQERKHLYTTLAAEVPVGIVKEVLKRLPTLDTPLPYKATLHYHNLAHTEGFVSASVVLAKAEGLDRKDRELLYVAGIYHDSFFGRIGEPNFGRYGDNEVLAAALAARELPRFGYTPSQINTIGKLILSTALSHAPKNILEVLMRYSDLHNVLLPVDEFLRQLTAYRMELASLGNPEVQSPFKKGVFTDKEWYQMEKKFLETHRFIIGGAAKELGLDDLRAANLKNVKALLEYLGDHDSLAQAILANRLDITNTTTITLSDGVTVSLEALAAQPAHL